MEGVHQIQGSPPEEPITFGAQKGQQGSQLQLQPKGQARELGHWNNSNHGWMAHDGTSFSRSFDSLAR
jgi:hypothetical protein